MSYWQLARDYARKHTSLSSPWTAVPTVVIVAIQQLLYHGTTWERVFVIIGITTLVYIALWTVHLLFNLLFRAPVAIHSEQVVLASSQGLRIGALESALKVPPVSALERSKREMVRKKLDA